MIEYIQANKNDIDVIFHIVQESIKGIYPKYYPKEVVDFFSELHCRENHITRVYVSPEYQGNGYGSYIMNCLELRISENYSKAELDASLPASHLYETRGYQTIKHCKYPVENDVILVYEVMEKELVSKNE